MGLALSLSGCVSYKMDDVLAEQPEGIYYSSKTVKEYTDCLDDRWLNRGNTIVRERGEGFLLMAEFNTHIIAAAKVEPIKKRTKITHFFPNPLQRKGLTNDVKECL